jgi:1-acyl-sn-glycerol-3-phosphate acyltransferase
MTVAMTGGSTRRGAGSRSRAPARPRAPALGNDPFVRGAAERPVAANPAPTATPAAASTPTPDALPASTPTPTPTATPTPAPTATPTADHASLEREAREALSRLGPALQKRLGTAADLARLVFAPPSRLDRFGMDPAFAERLGTAVMEPLYTTWWRVRVRGIEAVPSAGPVIVVANHAGVVPWDAFVLRHALRRDHPARRELRPLLDDRELALPVVGSAAIRAGAVRASPEAAERILAEGDAVGVFPEGSAGARKPWRDRYTLLRFGRGGFVKLALRARAIIVPCAIVGSEEAAPAVSRAGWLAERLGIPLLFDHPALRIAPAAFLPLPSRWSLRFGDPVDASELPPEAADDPAAVNALAERVRAALQGMLDEDVATRTSVYL